MEAKLCPGSKTLGLTPALSKPVGNRLTPIAQGRGGRMEESQLIHVRQELHELLQTNKRPSVVGLGKARVVLVQSL